MTNITIVDDSPNFNNLLTQMLQKDGYKVKSYSKVKDFLDDIDQMKIDVLILDICLDDNMNGFELYAQLEQMNKKYQTIFMSSSNFENYYEAAKRLNSLGFIPKEDIDTVLPLIRTVTTSSL